MIDKLRQEGESIEEDKIALYQVMQQLGLPPEIQTDALSMKQAIRVDSEYWKNKNEELTSSIAEMENQNTANEAAHDIMNKSLLNEKANLEAKLEQIKTARDRAKKENTLKELQIMDLSEEVSHKREELEKKRHEKYGSRVFQFFFYFFSTFFLM